MNVCVRVCVWTLLTVDSSVLIEIAGEGEGVLVKNIINSYFLSLSLSILEKLLQLLPRKFYLSILL